MSAAFEMGIHDQFLQWYDHFYCHFFSASFLVILKIHFAFLTTIEKLTS